MISDVESGEERYVTLGLDAQARLLVVVYTETEHPDRAKTAAPPSRLSMATSETVWLTSCSHPWA
jgi:hypothetical protein